jgi:hypothetical protein
LLCKRAPLGHCKLNTRVPLSYVRTATGVRACGCVHVSFRRAPVVNLTFRGCFGLGDGALMASWPYDDLGKTESIAMNS